MDNVDDKSTLRRPSNEEVIDELTRDLASSCVKDDNTENGSNTWDIPDGDDASTQGPNVLPPEDDEVDEESLKDRDMSLSEGEREVCFLYLGTIVMCMLQCPLSLAGDES